MATAKKTAAKKAAKPKALPAIKKSVKAESEPTYRMPQEVKDWIDRAQSIMNHQRGQIERLTKENTELKAYRRWAEQRILRSDHE